MPTITVPISWYRREKLKNNICVFDIYRLFQRFISEEIKSGHNVLYI